MQPPLFFILAFAALASAAPEHQPPSQAVQCPELAADLVCISAESGFNYNDGCNGVTCNGEGRASTSLMACPAPATAADLRHCERLARTVWGRLGPFTCPNANPDDVCPARGPGFAFSDGCNRVRCLAGGGYTSTRMSCPMSHPEGPYCQFVASALEADHRPEPRTDAVDEAKFECPALAYSRVCSEYLPGFAYHDGCRRVTCLAAGLARVPQDAPDCPAPEPGNAVATAYCEAAERRMLEKKARSSFHTTCLQADSVCRGIQATELVFHDGCNRCFCLPDRSAACTRVACPPRYLTPEEFSEHCKRVKAGQLPQK